MAHFKTLFEQLGVRPDASDSEIEAAWVNWLDRSNFDRDSIPQEVKHAYSFLQVAESRTLYREMLALCESEKPRVIRKDKLEAFKNACWETGLKYFADPALPDTYLLRRPDQKDPWWNNLPAEKPPPRKPTVGDYIREYMRRIVLLQVFRNKSTGQKVVLVLLYLASAFAATKAGMGLYSYASLAVSYVLESKEERAARLKTERERPIRSDYASAISALGALADGRDRIKDRFQRVTGIALDNAHEKGISQVPHLDLAIIGHDSVRQAWDDLLAARRFLRELDHQQSTASQIEERIEHGAFTNADSVALRGITGWAQQQAKVLASQMSNLEHLRVMLAAERFEQQSQTRERNAS